MARLFDDASSHYLQYAGAVTSAYPVTMACWFRSDDLTINQDLISIVASGATAGLSCLRLALRGATVGDPVAAISNDGTGPAGVAVTSSGYSANTWHHACARFIGDASREVRIDGGSTGTDTTNRPHPTANRTSVGALQQATSTAFMSGRIAEAAVWNINLSADEVAALARGVCPLSIRPLNLVAYWPLWGVHSTEIDLHPRSVVATDYDLTVSGATAANHPPVIPFSKRFWLPSQSLTVAASGNRRRRIICGASA